MKKKSKSFKNFIKDLVFNNPRADRQAGSMDMMSQIQKCYSTVLKTVDSRIRDTESITA